MSDLKKSDFENVVEGGPYTHEVDAIRDERHRANVMDVEPDFYALFEHATISTGAIQVINDINNPAEPVVGPFVENVVLNVEEENSPESGEEKGESESAENATEDSASEGPETEDLLKETQVHKDLELDLFVNDEKDEK
ncbi:hypothetical protein SEA_CASSEROLE_11 [Arthrobacter phage Casserole]|nr:hypothetical protein SEA_CASSEROLE_11 [Arthrobacter phage Casserole]